jgi:hypothetical protein
MGKDRMMVALDSPCFTYAVEAFQSVSGPPLPPCADEKRALFLIYLYLPNESCFHIGPTVKAEYARIRDTDKRNAHESMNSSLFCDFDPTLCPLQIDRRAQELNKSHNGPADCRVLAECEAAQMRVLLTYDHNFLKRLSPHARGVQLMRPSDLLAQMNIAPGTRPNRVPNVTNPISGAGSLSQSGRRPGRAC